MRQVATVEIEDEECPHGMGERSWCSICLHGPRRASQLRVSGGGGGRPGAQDGVPVRTMRAEFASHCPSCGRRIEAGQVIGLVPSDDREGQWLCCAYGLGGKDE